MQHFTGEKCLYDFVIFAYVYFAAFTQSNTSEESHERLTFHCQRRNELLVRLTEVDPFGNYSSPCYKGTALFYRVTRAELEWRRDKAVLRDAKLLANPICKLPLSLPKVQKSW